VAITGVLPGWCPGSDGGAPWRPSGQDHDMVPGLDPRLPVSQGIQEAARTEVSTKTFVTSYCIGIWTAVVYTVDNLQWLTFTSHWDFLWYLYMADHEVTPAGIWACLVWEIVLLHTDWKLSGISSSVYWAEYPVRMLPGLVAASHHPPRNLAHLPLLYC
jgi:hypothetical protein